MYYLMRQSSMASCGLAQKFDMSRLHYSSASSGSRVLAKLPVFELLRH